MLAVDHLSFNDDPFSLIGEAFSSNFEVPRVKGDVRKVNGGVSELDGRSLELQRWSSEVHW